MEGLLKVIDLAEKTIRVADKDITVKSKDLLSNAIESYQEGLKGIKNINVAIKIFNKIEASEGQLELEDAEFEMLYKAIDSAQWNPGILRFAEFFDEIEKIKNS